MKDFLKTSEASKLWGISSRRITQLAAKGRINGAVLVGNTWLIPSNAEKPIDGRTKKSQSNPEKYIFPYPIASLTSNVNFPDHYNDEERKLCHAQLLYESGDFEESNQTSVDLLAKTKNKYIRLGVIFNLIYVNIALTNYADAHKYLLEFRLLSAEPDPHDFEIKLLLCELDATFYGGNFLLDSFQKLPINSYSFEARMYLILLSSCVDFINIISGNGFNIIPYEIILHQLDSEGYCFSSVFMHNYLALFYSKTDVNFALSHLKKSVTTAFECNFVTSLSRYLGVDQNSFDQIIKTIPEEWQKTLIDKAKHINLAFSGFLIFIGKTNLFSVLSKDDYRFISLLLRGDTYAQISDILQMSESTVKRRVSALCKKVGVEHRAELQTLFVNTLMDSDFKI